MNSRFTKSWYIVAFALSAGLTLSTSVPAHADTAVGKSCGEKHPVSPDYYDGFGNAAPCTADFNARKAGIAHITIKVTEGDGIARNDTRKWSLDVHKCEGTVQPSDPPRTFNCNFGPGAHTVYVDKGIGDKFIDLKVDY